MVRSSGSVNPKEVGSNLLSTTSRSAGPCIFDYRVNFALTKKSSQSLVKYPIQGEGALSHLCAEASIELGGLLPATVTVAYPSEWLHCIACLL